MEQLMAYNQGGTVKDYGDTFRILFDQVRNLEEISEFYAIYIFICGLELEIRKTFARWHQYSCTKVEDVISLALKIDSNGLQDSFSPFDPNSSFYNKDLEFDINITLNELMKDNELFRNGKIQETCDNIVQETIVDEVIDYVHKTIEDESIQDECSKYKLYGEMSKVVGNVIQESIDIDGLEIQEVVNNLETQMQEQWKFNVSEINEGLNGKLDEVGSDDSDITSAIEVSNRPNNSKDHLSRLRNKWNNECEFLYQRVIKEYLFHVPNSPLFSCFDSKATTSSDVMGIQNETDVSKDGGETETSKKLVKTEVVIDWRKHMIANSGRRHGNEKMIIEDGFAVFLSSQTKLVNFNIHIEGCKQEIVKSWLFKWKYKVIGIREEDMAVGFDEIVKRWLSKWKYKLKLIRKDTGFFKMLVMRYIWHKWKSKPIWPEALKSSNAASNKVACKDVKMSSVSRFSKLANGLFGNATSGESQLPNNINAGLVITVESFDMVQKSLEDVLVDPLVMLNREGMAMEQNQVRKIWYVRLHFDILIFEFSSRLYRFQEPLDLLTLEGIEDSLKVLDKMWKRFRSETN